MRLQADLTVDPLEPISDTTADTTADTTSDVCQVIGLGTGERTALWLLPRPGALPRLVRVGVHDPLVTSADVRGLHQDREVVTSWGAWHHGSPVSLLPEHSDGWLGRPALLGFRAGAQGGTDWSPSLVPADAAPAVSTQQGRQVITAHDVEAGLQLDTELEPLPGGAIRLRHTLTNLGPRPYHVESLEVVLPVPDDHLELLDFTGRWAMEWVPQRHRITDGSWVREHRRGMRALDAARCVVTGSAGFGYDSGEVLSVHLAWSGNHRYSLERLSSGQAVLRAGELLHPGETVLARGQSYSTPWVHVSASREGLDGLAAAAHTYLREAGDSPARPLPVMLNVWEAAYFDHDEAQLTVLADLAADVGVERFVIDDGWFDGRDDATRGLGDWVPDPRKWPEGLRPFAQHVHARGMQFGLWWEPEAVNPDSQLFRAHPDWILATGNRLPHLERDSYVLDLSRREVRDHLLAGLDVMLGEGYVDFVKWDFNRDLIDGGSGLHDGSASASRQTHAFYALLDEARLRYPAVEWESCASGGGRTDLEVMSRVQSAWPSDNTDPISRQLVQHWSSQLLPLELLGAHIATRTSHQTGRSTSFDLRAATAMFGQLGIQLDLRSCPQAELDHLAAWIRLYKEHRALLHSGRFFRVDLGPHLLVHGVRAADQSEAVVSYAQLGDRVGVPPRLRITGLDRARTYRVRRVLPDVSSDSGWAAPGLGPRGGAAQWEVDGCVVSGAALASIGLPGPERAPESACIIHLSALP